MQFNQVSSKQFIAALKDAQDNYKHIRTATTPFTDIQHTFGTTYYLSMNGAIGFAVSGTGELTSVYSAIKGKGDELMIEAIKRGACHLDCFDGYLPKFYAKHGFTEVRREPNWTAGEPDVVYMAR